MDSFFFATFSFPIGFMFRYVTYSFRMSKFFHGSSSDSSDSDEPVGVPIRQAETRVRNFELPSDNEDEGPRRIVRTAKDKAYAELKESIRGCRNVVKINDLTKLLISLSLVFCPQ